MEFGPILKSLRHRKAFSSLIVLQVAITVTVMIISVLVTVVTLKEWNLPSGLDQENIIAVYPQIFDSALNVKEVTNNDLFVLNKIPGIKLVTPITQVPFGAENLTDVFLEEKEDAQSFRTSVFDVNEYGLDVLGVKLLDGREFRHEEVIYKDAEDQTRPAVVMISQEMAEDLFTDQNPVGRSLYLAKNQAPVEVIGIYSNFMNGERLNGIGKSYRSIIRPQVEYVDGQDPNYLIRVDPGQTEVILEEIRSQLYQTPGRFVQQVEFLTRTQKRMYDGRGSRSMLMIFISLVLLLITALGISGLISFLVAQQRKQIGTRRALGAKKWQIIRYYLLENSMVTGVGLTLGLILSMVLIIIMSQESGSEIIDVSWMVTIIVFVWIISLISAISPAKRASAVAPAIVTRGA